MELDNVQTFPGCTLALSQDSYCIHAPCEDVAFSLSLCFQSLTIEAMKLRRQKVLIYWPGCGDRPYEIPVTLIKSYIPKMTSISLSNDLDLSLEAHQNSLPVWITQMADQKVLLANRAALTANNRQPADILGKEITALWDDEPLQQLMSYLERDRQLTNYENPGYRWAMEEGSPIWRRDRYIFVNDYKLVEYLGVPCRFCLVKQAVKLSQSPHF